MDKLPELPPRPVRFRFEGWRRVFNPFVHAAILGDGSIQLKARWPRIFGGLLTGVIATFIVTATGAFLFVRYQEKVRSVGWIDFILPRHWPRIRTARGDRLIESAAMLAHDGQRLPALFRARDGVARSPAHREGRLLLAQLLFEAGRPELTRRVLLDGLGYHHADQKYLRSVFSFLFRRQEDSTVIATVKTYLPLVPADSECHRVYSLAAATAGYFRGNYDLAEDFLRTQPGLDGSRDGRLLLAKIEWERGYRDLALLRLRELAGAYPDAVEIHHELAVHLDLAEQADELRRSALAFQIAHSALPGPRIELLRAYRRTGDVERSAREARAFIHDFATDSGALLALADFAANTGDSPLARRLTEVARAANFAWEPHAILAVEAQVVARDFQGALDSARDLQHDNPDWTARFGPVLGSLQAIAHFGLGDTESASLMLTNYLNQSNLRAENLLAIAKRLVDVDAAESARQTLVRAITADPLNQAALTRLVELDLNLNRIDELPAHLARLLTMRKPSPDILRVAQHKLGSDRFLFSADRPGTLASIRDALEKSARSTSHP